MQLIPIDSDRYTKSRLKRYGQWLEFTHTPWFSPDLRAYRDALLAEGKALSTVSAALSTVRARYRSFLRDPQIRKQLYDLAASKLRELEQEDTPSNRVAFVSEIETRIKNALDPAEAPIKVVRSQDVADNDHTRLSIPQARELLSLPDTSTLSGKRDRALIALLLTTGIREQEACNLVVDDLRQSLGGEPALHIREGKGCKERLIPYGGLAWVLDIVQEWLGTAGIESGAVFRGLHKGDTLRPGSLSVRAVQYILSSYQLEDGTKVKPHDLRRTYARCLYEAGVDLVAIQQNLGHANVKTTLAYIGTLGADRRAPPDVY